MTTHEVIIAHMNEAEVKAWEALSRYKFSMFGYWSAIWVHLNRISGEKRKSPFKELVDAAKLHTSITKRHGKTQ